MINLFATNYSLQNLLSYESLLLLIKTIAKSLNENTSVGLDLFIYMKQNNTIGGGCCHTVKVENMSFLPSIKIVPPHLLLLPKIRSKHHKTFPYFSMPSLSLPLLCLSLSLSLSPVTMILLAQLTASN
jgi:hypothetical protein